MIRVTVWLQLLLLVLVLRRSAAASDQCKEKQSEIDRLEEALKTTTAQKHDCEIHDVNCHDLLTKQIYISQQTDALNNNLKKQLEAKEEVLKAYNEKQTQMQTAIDGLTKAVESLNQKSDLEIGQWKAVQTVIDRLTKTVELINQRSEFLCRTQKDVCPSLLAAAKDGDVNTAKVLFKCSNDKCTDDDQYSSTPLTYAAANGHVEVVRVLLEEGADVNRADGSVYTALHHAAWNGHLDVCRLLLDWGAKVNALNKALNTPLIWAAWAGHLSIAKLLVERGAEVSLKNADGDTASVFARREGKSDVADWLDSVKRRKRR